MYIFYIRSISFLISQRYIYFLVFMITKGSIHPTLKSLFKMCNIFLKISYHKIII